MALRNIRPSFSETSASASASAPSQSTSESTGSDPRYPALSGDRDPKGKESAPAISKRRRVPDSITRNACMNCKKARAKCDGQKPCSRCDSRSEHAACVYEIHIKHAKEELLKQIIELRDKDRQSRHVYRALQSENLGPDVLNFIKRGESQEAIAEWLDQNAPTDHHDHDGYSPQISGHEPYPVSDDTSQLPPLPWTNVIRDPVVLRHLFQLYFTWVHPVSMILSERHFLESFHNRTDNFCSQLLVNAICALACSLHSQQDTDDAAYDQLGSAFAVAFRDEFDPADKCITTIQATAVMFLVELSRGSPRAAPYLKLATERITEVTALARVNMPSLVLKVTIQGLRCLNVEWAQAIFECPLFLESRPVETAIDDDEDLNTNHWHFYRYESERLPSWPSLLKTVNAEKLKLISIINDVCAMMYGASSIKVTALGILEQYARFQAWYQALPPQLVVGAENQSQSLPHALSLLILYNHSVTQLLRPLIDFKEFPSLTVEEVVFTHAQRGLYLLEIYRDKWKCRQQPVLQMFVISNLCDLVARYYPTKRPSSSNDKDGCEALIFGLGVLEESFAGSTGSPVAGVLRELLRTSYSKSIIMPMGQEYLLEPSKDMPVHSYEDFMDACTRAVYFQPLWGVREKFESDLATNFLRESARFGFRPPQPQDRSLRVLEDEPDRSANYLMQIKNLLNNS